MAEKLKRVIPLYGRILVKHIEKQGKSKKGILLPDNRQNDTYKGRVVAVGAGMLDSKGDHIPCCVKEGDVVLLPDYGRTKVRTAEDEEFFIYREKDVLAVIKD